MSGQLVLAFVIIAYYLKKLPASTLEIWGKLFRTSLYGIAILAIIGLAESSKDVSMWAGHLILLSIVYINFLKPGFKTVRNVMVAALPYIIISFVSNITKYAESGPIKDLHGYVNLLVPFTFVWMIAMLINYNKQQKALKLERLQRLSEAEQNKIVALRKTELERMVSERTAELLLQKNELETALTELKATQSQLIHSEKMASLGELTAGIAHEIQNPLNFVNNFSEVSIELVDEMEEELNNGDTAAITAIAADLKKNMEKIHHHGRRADSIVKNMLQHSRKSTGQKEPTNINALADEYMRLSYHGLRAKDKSFNASFKTDFDESIGSINVSPQDIGRVLLNLFNSSFYAVNEKKKHLKEGYEPTVSVSTKKVITHPGDENIEITVRDNGNGIPQKELDKIFQPFFTTKPTGQGTGLGLSLSYDIITKGHEGDLKVNTKEGEFAEFIIILPV